MHLIHELVSEIARTVEEDPAQTLWAQMRLRAELGDAAIFLPEIIRFPKCVQLLELRWTPDTAAEMLALASDAIAEVEEAQTNVWSGLKLET